jgi:23S rRNA (adenine2503-C2)-methyltransferase
MTDLAKSLRDKLAGRADMCGPEVIRPSTVGRRHHQVAVRRRRRQCGRDRVHPEDDRGTLCVSSQAGCAVGCRFCSTGHQGFSRNLTTGEIVAQLWFAEHRCASCPPRGKAPQQRRRARHLQRRDDGHGRAAAELRALVPALRVMLDDHGYGLSRRRVTVSTSGVVPMIDRLRAGLPGGAGGVAACAHRRVARPPGAAEPQVPAGRTAGCLQALPGAAPRDFITFEYCMLDGVNDSPSRRRKLVAWCAQGGARLCPASST